MVRDAAREAVLDGKFQGILANRVRPSLVFNTHESIDPDFGAAEHISDISGTPESKFYGFNILIKAKHHLAYAPLITAIDINLFQSTADRDRLNDWRIQMTPNTTVPGILAEDALDINVVHRFRLDILH
jgi:hypothetical protein